MEHCFKTFSLSTNNLSGYLLHIDKNLSTKLEKYIKLLKLFSVPNVLLSARMTNKIILALSLWVLRTCASPTPYIPSLATQQLRSAATYDNLKYLPLNYNALAPILKNPLDSYYAQMQNNSSEKQTHPELGLNVTQLIERHGYTVETHTVTTKDRYILELHRIPHGKNNANQTDQRKVALVMPGILCSSADWVVNGPESAVAYILAEEGYDVWLGNPRGTTSSRKHVDLNPDTDKHFWDFSYHEMGMFDLPAIIDYILDATQQPDLYYIAHSQGATSFFVMASELPEYNNKIRLMSALAPVTYSSDVKNPILKIVLPYLDELIVLAEKLEIYEFLRHIPLITKLGQALCNDDAPTQKLCSLVLFLTVGFDRPQLNTTMLPVIFSNFPAGASVKQFWHFGQGMRSDDLFQQYDYGPEDNMNIYGQEEPPQYNLTKVTAPVAAYYSRNDWISSDKDVRQLISVLPNVIRNHRVKNLRFNHMDYMWAIDVKKLVYDYIIADMKKY